jgi:serine/threonine protein kinase
MNNNAKKLWNRVRSNLDSIHKLSARSSAEYFNTTFATIPQRKSPLKFQSYKVQLIENTSQLGGDCNIGVTAEGDVYYRNYQDQFMQLTSKAASQFFASLNLNHPKVLKEQDIEQLQKHINQHNLLAILPDCKPIPANNFIAHGHHALVYRYLRQFVVKDSWDEAEIESVVTGIAIMKKLEATGVNLEAHNLVKEKILYCDNDHIQIFAKRYMPKVLEYSNNTFAQTTKFARDLSIAILVLTQFKIIYGNLKPDNCVYDPVADKFLLQDYGAICQIRDDNQVIGKISCNSFCNANWHAIVTSSEFPEYVVTQPGFVLIRNLSGLIFTIIAFHHGEIMFSDELRKWYANKNTFTQFCLSLGLISAESKNSEAAVLYQLCYKILPPSVEQEQLALAIFSKFT